jgi:transposase-like protein
MPAKRTVKRYTEEEKSEIFAFIEKFNAENGRGGQTAAVKKFKVTPMTLSAWNKKSGKTSAKSKKAAKKMRNPSKLWDRLNTVKAEIAKLEKSLSKLNAESKELRKEIRSCID